ncbi:MAG: NAD(P)/FAD-dependent oxidoreductase [Gammaproteobacteria bacterium]
MRIAIVGSGIAGNVVAQRLHAAHEIVVFEAAGRVGGHSHTHTVHAGGREYAVDTGFIVYNERTYPRFTRLLAELGVATRPTVMSFSVQCERSGLEYNGTDIDGLFAQRRNLLRPRFWRMLADVVRFNRDARRWLASGDATATLAQYLAGFGPSREFVEQYLRPMAAAIWSADPRRIDDFPARALLGFFANHGLLDVADRPRWRTVAGGSARYVERLTAPFADRIRLDAPVVRVRRMADAVEIGVRGCEPERFDCAFLACHSDQALAMLADPSPAESQVLGAIAYQDNDAWLHTDKHALPRNPRAHAAWNYYLPAAESDRATVTYDMNRLQGLDAPETFCVTLNGAGRVDPARVLARMSYAHPVFDAAALAAQRRRPELHRARTFYCGAWWGNGFHEDAVASAHAALDDFARIHSHAQLPLRRTG